MRIAVTASGPTLEDQVDPRFGRCAYFLVVDTESMEFEALENPNISLGGGAGIQSAQLMAEQGVQTLITGNCGPNAFQTLNTAGIVVIVGASGVVRQAIKHFNSGALKAAPEPTVASHFGMGGGMGMGRGMGGGRRMGGGRGMGMGRGMGGGGDAGFAPQGAGASPVPPSPGNEAQELAAVKEQAKAIQQQLDQVLRRIDELEGKKK